MVFDFLLGPHSLAEVGLSPTMSCGWDGLYGNPAGSYKFVYPDSTFTTASTDTEQAIQSIGFQDWNAWGVPYTDLVLKVVLVSFDYKFATRRLSGTGSVSDTITLNILDVSGAPILTSTLYTSGIPYSTAWTTVTPGVSGTVATSGQAADSQVRLSVQYQVSGFGVEVVPLDTPSTHPYAPGGEMDGGTYIPPAPISYNGFSIDNIVLAFSTSGVSGITPDPPAYRLTTTRPCAPISSSSGTYGMNLDSCHPYRGARFSTELLGLSRSSLIDMKLIEDTAIESEDSLAVAAASYLSAEISLISSVQHSRAQTYWRIGRW